MLGEGLLDGHGVEEGSLLTVNMSENTALGNAIGRLNHFIGFTQGRMELIARAETQLVRFGALMLQHPYLGSPLHHSSGVFTDSSRHVNSSVRMV